MKVLHAGRREVEMIREELSAHAAGTCAGKEARVFSGVSTCRQPHSSENCSLK